MNNTLVNGLELLQYLAGSPRPFGVSELAQIMELPKSHIHRLLQTLVANHYVNRDANRQYSIGVGALRLGHALLRDIPIRNIALPKMMPLAQKLNLHLTLALPFGNQAISIAHVMHNGSIKDASVTLGEVMSPYASASGKLFLAHLPTKKRDMVVQQFKFVARGPNTHNDPAKLKQDLIEIAQRGYSTNDLENGHDAMSLAVPIHDAKGHAFACLAASGNPTTLPKEHFAQVAAALQEAVDEIEATVADHK